MKKLYSLIILLVITISSRGQLILHEPFNYTPDAVLGLSAQSSNVWQIVNTGDSILLENGNLSYTGLATSSGNKIKFDNAGTDYYRVFANQTSGTVYSSFVLNVSSIGTMNAAGGYFTGFIQSGSTSLFGAAVWTRLSTTTGKYNVGISTRSNSAVTWLAADLDPATSYFIVYAYDMIAGTGNDVARIWLNTSAIGGTEPVADATSVVGTDLANVERIFLRQASTTGTPFIEMDEIRIGTTWASVTPSGAPSPSLTISSPVAAFGNVCINTSAGPNTFTVSGSNLTAANVTITCPVGYTVADNAAGPYASLIFHPQPGGTFSQQYFVKFDPTLVQSYNSNILVAGGGVTTPVSMPVTGAGVNTAPSVTSGAASAITQTTATVAGSITATGCSAVTAYGIEYSTTAGFANGTGTAVASTNLAAGNFSSDLAALATGTTYYYHAYATNAGGTSYGAEQSFTTATPNPTINATALTAFGNVCINTTAGPNSFTISGSNLTTADVTVAALAGYTYSTTAGGTYTTSLTLIQPGGTYSQEIFVKFDPTAVQSYDGNIVVNGGGIAAAVNVAAAGTGVNTAPSVTSGAASAITQTTATVAGTITATGCSAVTAYGIEYSTTNNFPNGTGTQVASTNLAAGSFSSALSGLTANTVYYYKAYATNAGGTTYGVQQTFTTAAPPPPAITVTALNGFGSTCINTEAGPNSFIINGTNLTTANITVGPLAGYTFAETAGGTYTASLSITQTGGTQSKNVYVKFTPTAVQAYNGNIPVTGGGVTATVNVAVTGAGVNTTPTVTTGAASTITTSSVVLTGTAVGNGCSPLTELGFEYSGINGFADGTGTKVLSTVAFSTQVTGLVQGATYYYKAYAKNAGGTGYGAQQSFTLTAIPNEFRIFPVPAQAGAELKFSINNLKPGYYALLFLDAEGKLVYQKNINIQATFINQSITLPSTISKGTYRVQLVNTDDIIATKTILIL